VQFSEEEPPQDRETKEVKINSCDIIISKQNSCDVIKQGRCSSLRRSHHRTEKLKTYQNNTFDVITYIYI
jgi:hypothetical protein